MNIEPSPTTLRAIALDYLRAKARKQHIIALDYPGRLLATTQIMHAGDVVRVPVFHENAYHVVDFIHDVIYAQWYDSRAHGDWRRGKLYIYMNQREDLRRFATALDEMLAACDP